MGPPPTHCNKLLFLQYLNTAHCSGEIRAYLRDLNKQLHMKTKSMNIIKSGHITYGYDMACHGFHRARKILATLLLPTVMTSHNPEDLNRH
jgi:hypothetical protein